MISLPKLQRETSLGWCSRCFHMATRTVSSQGHSVDTSQTKTAKSLPRTLYYRYQTSTESKVSPRVQHKSTCPYPELRTRALHFASCRPPPLFTNNPTPTLAPTSYGRISKQTRPDPLALAGIDNTLPSSLSLLALAYPRPRDSSRAESGKKQPPLLSSPSFHRGRYERV